MKDWKIISIILLGFVLALGCGDANENESSSGDGSGDDGDDGDGGGGGGADEVDLSVDEDTPADELTEEELQDVCGDIYEAIAPGLTAMETAASEFTCLAMGVGMAQLDAMSGGTTEDIIASCEDYADQCENGEMDDMMDAGDTGMMMTEEEFCEGADESVEDCDASAGDIADCMVAMFNAELAAFDEYMSQIPECDDLTAEYYDNMMDMEEMPDEVETPAECAAVMEQCPELFEDME